METDVYRMTHVGMCVIDMAESVRFYRDGLGFKEVAEYRVGNEFAPLDELDELDLHVKFLERDGFRIELLQFVTPGHEGEPHRRRMNIPGLTHFALDVGDLDAVLERLRALGADVAEHTRVSVTHPGTPGPTVYIYATDPNGVRLELTQVPAKA